MGDTTQQDIYVRLVKDIMISDVVTIDVSATIHDALSQMGENRVSVLPVVDKQGKCVGILSTSDLVDMTRDVDEDLYIFDMVDPSTQRFLLDKLVHSMGSEPIQSYMSEIVASVDLHTTIGRATREMLENRVHHLPVINEHGELAGIVSTMDILAEFVDCAPEAC